MECEGIDRIAETGHSLCTCPLVSAPVRDSDADTGLALVKISPLAQYACHTRNTGYSIELLQPVRSPTLVDDPSSGVK
jgi:hypothetical protein